MKLLNELFSKMETLAPVTGESRLKTALKPELPENLKKAWRLAVFEAETNIGPCPYGGEFFTAGGRGGWFHMLFGQDTVACGLLAFNKLYPEVMKNQLRSYVTARLNIGFMCPEGWELENCDKAIPLHMDVWQPNSREFCNRYHMSPALNRTGQDVGWLWTAGDLFDMYGDRMDWAWLYGMGNIFFDYFIINIHTSKIRLIKKLEFCIYVVFHIDVIIKMFGHFTVVTKPLFLYLRNINAFDGFHC